MNTDSPVTMNKQAVIDTLFRILGNAREQGYIGEAISQLEHALQAAKIAEEMNGSDDLILAALFHDLGHLCAPEDARKMDEFGIDGHHRIAADFLKKLGFSDKLATLIEGHVEAKRYLVFKNPKYFNELSNASQETLKRQGGPMNAEEAHAFEAHPLFKEMLRLRTCDDRAKQADWTVPGLEDYREKIKNHLSNLN